MAEKGDVPPPKSTRTFSNSAPLFWGKSVILTLGIEGGLK